MAAAAGGAGSVIDMLHWLERLRDRVRESLFLLPTAGVAGAALLAWVAIWLDNLVGDELQDLPILLRTTTDGARALLTTAAAATITVAGIVLSVTVVAVQLAASQFSPRVVATILGSRFQQTVIAIVTGAFTYDLLVLSTVGSNGGDDGASRSIAITVALVLAIGSVMAIIAFIDRSVQVMRVGEVIRRSADDTLASIRRRHPERGSNTGAADDTTMPDGTSVTIRAERDGWVQDVETGGLLKAIPSGSVGRLDSAIGSFVGVGSPLVTIWAPEEGDHGEFDNDRIRRAFEIGDVRRARSDPTFGVRQLVDIALRALSPGINDPTTANEVVLHLTEILREVMVRDLPPRAVHGDEGKRLFRPHDWSRRDWVRHAFSEIRTASTTQPEVARQLIAALGSLREYLDHEGIVGRADVLATEASLVLEGLDTSDSVLEEDLSPIRELAVQMGLVAEPSE
jgi:uncharacterized membrane protein